MDQLSYVNSPGNFPVQYLTIPDKLKEQAELHPNKEIFIFYSLSGQRESITFSELYWKSVEFSRVLTSLGIQKGDKVIIRLSNSTDWLIIVFGLMTIGAIPVSSYIVRKDVADVNYIVEKTHAVAMFFSGGSPSLRDIVKGLVEQDSSKFKFAVSTDIDSDDGVLLSYRKMVNVSVDKNSVCNATIDPDDIALIMRSSGTTGRPKLIPHSHLNLQKMFGHWSKESCKMYSNAEFSWFGGSPIAQIFSGVPRVTISGEQSMITIERHLHVIESESCSLIGLTTDVLKRILNDNFHFPPCVDIVGLSGTPIKKKFQVFLEFVNCLLCAYGTLENGGVSMIQIVKGMDLEDNIGGYAVPGVEIKITDDSNKVVSRGTKGRIFIRSEKQFQGYYSDAEMTKKVLSPSKWYDTGDVGYISESNKLFVIGRSGESVTRDTVTNSVTEIENLIMELNIPQIEDVVIVPVPDEIHDEEICACVILKRGQTVSQDALLQLFDGLIDGVDYKPKYVVFMDSFPVNINGKLMRKDIAEFAIQTLFENV